VGPVPSPSEPREFAELASLTRSDAVSQGGELPVIGLQRVRGFRSHGRIPVLTLLLLALGSAATGACRESRARETSIALETLSSSGMPAAPEPLGSLDGARAALVIPPPWLETVETGYDTTQPWKEARLEVRRLLEIGTERDRREALKLMWIYRENEDISDGHEYPMYTFLGGEPAWSLVAHEQFLALPAGKHAMHAHRSLAALYAGFREYAKAQAVLDRGLSNLPAAPWEVLAKAELLEVRGDVFARAGEIDAAKRAYAEAARLFPTARPSYGAHLLPKKAARARAKLDLLSARTLDTATLADGEFRGRALGYAKDLDVTVSVRARKIVEVRVRHRETISHDAEHIVPAWIVTRQSLDVDGITGATLTRDAIVSAALQALRRAGLE
jgi:uncharacterized protein with FMN-binding domain